LGRVRRSRLRSFNWVRRSLAIAFVDGREPEPWGFVILRTAAASHSPRPITGCCVTGSESSWRSLLDSSQAIPFRNQQKLGIGMMRTAIPDWRCGGPRARRPSFRGRFIGRRLKVRANSPSDLKGQLFGLINIRRRLAVGSDRHRALPSWRMHHSFRKSERLLP
jgi:hypothetical protein